MNKKSVILFCVITLTPSVSFGQSQSIGMGWARNSINTVVFRKNSVVTHGHDQYIAYYDSLGVLTLGKRRLGGSSWQIEKTQYKGNTSDAHRSISIMADGEGTLHVSWNHHGDSLHYCKGVKPGSLKLSERIVMIGDLETNVTYPEFYRFPGGDLFFLYRDGASGNGNLVINRYHLASGTWTRIENMLLDGEGQRNAYWQACVDLSGTFHISWVWRESGDVSSNHDMCYAKTEDFGITWRKSTGETYTLPINQQKAEYVLRIPQKSELINQTSMCADSNGTPYIATYFTTSGSTVPQYHLLFQENGRWKTTQVSRRMSPFTLQGGGTKKIPISRPQILVEEHKNHLRILFIYRDSERGNRVTLSVSQDAGFDHWKTFDATEYSLESWEPSYDTELWKSNNKLHLFVQKAGQGDGEKLESLAPQPVHILEINNW